MTLKGANSTQACAACKYQRKRCTPECSLAPHFRPEHPAVFKNAHKLFGVRNILRILEQANPHHRTEAMQSIIYEANMRDRFPVHGCLTVICDLQYQIRQAEEELYSILTRLAFYKQHHERQQQVTQSVVLSHDLIQSLALFRHNDSTPLSISSSYHTGNVHINAFWLQETSNTSNIKHKPLVSRHSIIEEVIHDHDEIYPFFNNIED